VAILTVISLIAWWKDRSVNNTGKTSAGAVSTQPG
jgi:hypothetical protein